MGVRDEKGEVETYKRVRETSEGRVTERASERERGGREIPDRVKKYGASDGRGRRKQERGRCWGKRERERERGYHDRR